MLIERIHLRNLLSFGPLSEPIELQPLNVFIGPNGSGKSNFLDAINLVRSTPDDVWATIRAGGGAAEWIHKGKDHDPPASVELIARVGPNRIRYYVVIMKDENGKFSIGDEEVVALGEEEKMLFGFREDEHRGVTTDDYDFTKSVLAQYRDPFGRSPMTQLARAFSKIRCYRGWPITPGSPLRNPQRTDGPAAYLLEDGSNLGLVLNRISLEPSAWRRLRQTLRSIYEDIDDIAFEIDSSTVRVLIREKHFVTTSSRMSDGTLRFLCLLSVLLDPNPAPLICIDEPELGLHPDVIHKVADLLRDASTRTQLIVTTHSRELLDALSDEPECVSVFERVDGQTTVKRLAGQPLLDWLREYGVGRAWRDGELGGNRW